MIHEDDIKWVFKSSMNLKNQHHSLYRDDELKVQCETLTNKTDGGYGIGRSRSFYYIDNDIREFKSAKEMVDAYNEKFILSEENPEYEVKYVKVLVKIKPHLTPPKP